MPRAPHWCGAHSQQQRRRSPLALQRPAGRCLRPALVWQMCTSVMVKPAPQCQCRTASARAAASRHRGGQQDERRKRGARSLFCSLYRELRRVLVGWMYLQGAQPRAARNHARLRKVASLVRQLQGLMLQQHSCWLDCSLIASGGDGWVTWVRG